MDFSQLDKKTKKIAFDFNGEQVEVELYERRLRTPKMVSQLNAATKNEDVMGLASGLARAIKGWNLHNAGKEFLPTEENLALAEFDFLAKIVELGFADANPTSASGSQSI